MRSKKASKLWATNVVSFILLLVLAATGLKLAVVAQGIHRPKSGNTALTP